MTRPSFDPGFSTEALTELYSPESVVAAMLRFEEALALALADAGIAPRDEAEEVAAACRSGVTDPDAVLASTWDEGTPLIALRESIGAGEWFHHGATSQDAIDTAQMLLAHSALGQLETHLAVITRLLRALTTQHRGQPHMGRTFLQDARVTTFGFRTAGWLDAVTSHIAELRHQRDTLVVQLGGPVGTAEAFGEKANEMADYLAQRVGLSAPDISWHGDRTRVLALAQAVERMAKTMSKIALDVALLASSAIAEVRVRSGRSSSMPDKQNPIDSIRAVAAASACTGAVAMLTGAPPSHLDRAVGTWHVEWVALPLVFQTAGAAAEAIETCLESLEVDTEAMLSNAGGKDSVVVPAQIDRILTRSEDTVPS